MTIEFRKLAAFGLLPPEYSPNTVKRGWPYKFVTADAVDGSRSANWAHDAERFCITPARPNVSSNIGFPFTTLTGWTEINPGSADVVIGTAPSDPDPNLRSFMDMTTGFDPPSSSLMAGAQKVIGTVPDSFGIGTIIKLNQVGTYQVDALQFFIQTNSGRQLLVRFYDMRVDVFIGGGWQQIAAWGGNWWTEWWVECGYLGAGQCAVSVYAGTQKQPTTLTGALPTGSSGNNNLLAITQLSGANNNRHSQCAVVNVGTTQLPADMVLSTHKLVLPTTPSVGNVGLILEDVSVSLAPNDNLIVGITKDDTATLAVVDLDNNFDTGLPGLIDPSKTMRLVTGAANFVAGSGVDSRMTVNTNSGGLFAVLGIGMFWNY